MGKYFNFGKVFSMGNNVSISGSDVNINGKSIKVPNGSSVSVVNGVLYVDGKKWEDEELEDKQIVQLVIQGNVGNVNSSVDVCIEGDVTGDVSASRDVDIRKGVHGNIHASRDVEVGKDVNGNIKAGRDVEVEGNYIKK